MMHRDQIKKAMALFMTCIMILSMPIILSSSVQVLADNVNLRPDPRLVTGMTLKSDKNEVDGGNTVTITAQFMDTQTKPEPVIVTVGEGGKLLVESNSDIPFITNGVLKSITDLEVNEDLNRMTFMTGAPAVLKVSTFSFQVEASLELKSFDVQVQIGTGIGSKLCTIKIISGLSINISDVVNDIDPFYITGNASYKGSQPPDKSYVFVEVINKETGEPMDEIQFISDITNKEFSIGPITLPSKYDDGVYIINIYLMHDDLYLLGTAEKEFTFKKVDKTVSIKMKPDGEIYADSRVVTITPLDVNQNPIPYNKMDLTVSGNAALSQSTVKTESDGTAQITVTNSTDEYVILSAKSFGGLEARIPIDFREIPNLAFNQKVTVSDVIDNDIETYGGENLIDGDHITRWSSGSNNDAFVEIEFDEPRKFDKIDINTCLTTTNVINTYKIEYFDGEWKTAYDGANMGADILARFPDVTGSKVRIHVKGMNPSIYELSIYDTNDYILTVRDRVIGTNTNGDIITENTTMRQFIYGEGQQIQNIAPLDYSNITVTIPPQFSNYLKADNTNIIRGNMPGSNVDINYLYEYKIGDPEGPIKEILKINIMQDKGTIRLKDETEAFNYIWVANSSKGTVVKIDTDTGNILAEYRTAPDGAPHNPSRTTVDKDGSVWVTNRDNNSVVKIGLKENGQWIDKNGNGVCDTSIGLNDVKDWKNGGDIDTNGGVSTAEDECILFYIRTSSSGTRHLAVDEDNNVWVSGTGNRIFDLIDAKSGDIIRSEGSVGFGGYGGLIDKNGVIWSSNPLLRWDTKKPLSGENGKNWIGYDHSGSYGLGIDSNGNVWNSGNGTGLIKKFRLDGTLIGSYYQGHTNAQGVVIGKDDDVWVAHSLYNNTIGHLKNDGTYVGTISVTTGANNGPTGVAVDDKGFIWATCYNGTVVKIDPTLGPIGDDGVTRVGQVVYVSENLGGLLYNYSDMTGSTLIGAPSTGTWEFVYDAKVDDIYWNRIKWDPDNNGDETVQVWLSTSQNNFNWSDPVEVLNNSDFSVPNGRYVKATVRLNRSLGGISPIINSMEISSIAYE